MPSAVPGMCQFHRVEEEHPELYTKVSLALMALSFTVISSI